VNNYCNPQRLPLTKHNISKIVNLVFKAEGNKNYCLIFNFIPDKEIRKINKNYLNHNYVTDIIAFPYTENDNLIDGELFICLEQVKKNSKLYGSLKNEIRRVIIHGCLHLLGYDDRTQKQTLLIRQKEDYYLSKEK
jgi:probable rRNA maturation factor